MIKFKVVLSRNWRIEQPSHLSRTLTLFWNKRFINCNVFLVL